ITSATQGATMSWTASAPGTVSITASDADASTTVSVTVADTGLEVFAGSPGGLGFADGPGPEARLLAPHGLVSDGDGGVYLADYRSVRHWSGGELRTVAGLPTGSPANCTGQGPGAGLPGVTGIARDASGLLYVSGDNGTICKVDAQGTVTLLATLGTPIDGLAFGAGRLAAVHDHGEVTEVNLDGSIGRALGAAGQVEGWDIQGIAALADGSIAIAGITATAPRQAVLATVGSGTVTPFFSTATPWPGAPCGSALLCMPEGIVARPDGQLLVADFGKSTVSRYDGSGLHLIAGIPNQQGHEDGAVSKATLGAAQALALDEAGALWMVDNSDGLLRKLDAAGSTVTTLAGIPSGSGEIDGPGVATRLRFPAAVAVGPDGSVYVAEMGGRIVRATPGGFLSTLANVTSPTHLVVGPGGDLLVSCADATIRAVSPAGKVTVFAGDGVAGFVDDVPPLSARFGKFAVSSEQVTQGFAGGALAYDGATVYVADAENLRVRKIAGGQVTTFALLSDPPQAVAVSGGDVYILAGQSRIERWSGGALASVIPIDSVPFASLAADAAGTLYVTRTFPGKVTVIPAGGNAAVLAGTAGVEAVRPGPLPASLEAPVSIALAPPGAPNAGALFLADFADNAVVVLRR
ncbi:MAG TPA: hypothetical protein VI160_07510, partial [Gemmatimonadales bacterium]